MAGEYQRELLAAYRTAWERLQWQGWEGDLELALADTDEVNTVHLRHRIPDPVLTPEQQERVDEQVAELMIRLDITTPTRRASGT
jgi:hypothetical protein